MSEPGNIGTLLERFAAQNPGDIDLERLGAVLEHVWDFYTGPNSPIEGIEEAVGLGAELRLAPLGDDLELRLVRKGRVAVLDRIPLALVRSRPSG